MRLMLCLILTLVFVAPTVTYGQTCPHGYMPLGGGQAGWSGCAPIGNAAQPPDPGPEWATRWGAIAVDPSRSAWGFFDGAPSKRRASKAAVDSCKKNGGKKCKIYIAYYNQCGALASGDNRITTFGAPESEQAEREAIRSCSEKTENCGVVHSGCSYPQQVR